MGRSQPESERKRKHVAVRLDTYDRAALDHLANDAGLSRTETISALIRAARVALRAEPFDPEGEESTASHVVTWLAHFFEAARAAPR